MLLVNSSVRKSPRQLIFHMVPHNHIWKKICESIFEIKSKKKYWKKYSKKIHKEYLSKNLLWEKRDKVFKAFIALSEALDNSSVSKNPRQLIFYMVPHNHFWKKICEKIFERKSEKEYSKEIPRKNSVRKSPGQLIFYMFPHNYIWKNYLGFFWIFFRWYSSEYSFAVFL